MEFEWSGPVLDFAQRMFLNFSSFDWAQKNWEAAVSLAIGVFGTSATIFIRWRNSGRRLVKRLREFIEYEEARLDGAKDELSALLERTSPDSDVGFCKSTLGKRFRQMRWGLFRNPKKQIEKALQKAAVQLDLSKERALRFEEELVLSHLMLGAEADSSGSHQKALSHFNAVLEYYPDDLDALEYAGLQLIKIGSAAVALREGKYLRRVVSLAKKANNKVVQARAHRLIALAYERLPEPSFRRARQELIKAVETFPRDFDSFELAHVWEHLGLVRMKCKSYGSAQESFLEAQNRYVSLPQHRVKKDLERIRALLHSAATEQQKTQSSEVGVETGIEMSGTSLVSLMPTVVRPN